MKYPPRFKDIKKKKKKELMKIPFIGLVQNFPIRES